MQSRIAALGLVGVGALDDVGVAAHGAAINVAVSELLGLACMLEASASDAPLAIVACGDVLQIALILLELVAGCAAEIIVAFLHAKLLAIDALDRESRSPIW